MKTLIQALRDGANKIEDKPHAYEWNYPSTCNCGYLVQAATDLSASELRKYSEIYQTWASIVDNHKFKFECNIDDIQICTVSGKSFNALIKELRMMGMKPIDFVELENLSNPDIKERANISELEDEIFTATRSPSDDVENEFTNASGKLQKLYVDFVSIEHPYWQDSLHTEYWHEFLKLETAKLAVRYMRAWADILEEQEALKIAEEVNKTVEEIQIPVFNQSERFAATIENKDKARKPSLVNV